MREPKCSVTVHWFDTLGDGHVQMSSVGDSYLLDKTCPCVVSSEKCTTTSGPYRSGLGLLATAGGRWCWLCGERLGCTPVGGSSESQLARQILYMYM